MDEIKHFFSQLDSLKSSFKPWTSKLKQMLRLDEMDNYKDESNDIINNEDIINQYQFVNTWALGFFEAIKNEFNNF